MYFKKITWYMKRTRSSDALVSHTSKRRRTNAYMATSQKKLIKREILRQIETKRAYTLATASAIDYNGTLFELFPNAQGSSDQYIVGNKITPTFIRVRYAIDVGDSTNLVRMSIIQWKGKPPADPPLGSQVFNGTTSVNAPLGGWDLTYKRDFRVLADHTHCLHTYNPKQFGELLIPANKLRPVQYQDQDTASVPIDGAIYLVAISDSAASAHPALQHWTSIYYKDA